MAYTPQNDIPTDAKTTRTPVQARQGFLDRPVLAVLIVSLVLAGIAMVTVHDRSCSGGGLAKVGGREAMMARVHAWQRCLGRMVCEQ